MPFFQTASKTQFPKRLIIGKDHAAGKVLAGKSVHSVFCGIVGNKGRTLARNTFEKSWLRFPEKVAAASERQQGTDNRTGILGGKAKAAYRQKHESDFIIADAAARYFRENGISKLPSYKALQAEIESLIKEKNSGYNDYRAKREEYRRLQTVKGNIDQILRRERKPVKRQEQER